jgi:hypothetical protein
MCSAYALQFFLNSWYKHKQAGTGVPDRQQVLFDFVRFRALEPLSKLRTKPPQVQPKE